MKNKFLSGLLILLVSFLLSGCSVMTTFVVRNQSAYPVLVKFSVSKNSTLFSYGQQIKEAKEIIRLNKSGIKSLNIPVELQTRDSIHFSFLLSPGHSAKISPLFGRAKLDVDEIGFYNKSKEILEIKNWNDVRIHFKSKNRVLGGSGLIYYYDIK